MINTILFSILVTLLFIVMPYCLYLLIRNSYVYYIRLKTTDAISKYNKKVINDFFDNLPAGTTEEEIGEGLDKKLLSYEMENSYNDMLLWRFTWDFKKLIGKDLYYKIEKFL